MSAARPCPSVSTSLRGSPGVMREVHHTQTRATAIERAMRRPAETRCRAWLTIALESGAHSVEHKTLARLMLVDGRYPEGFDSKNKEARAARFLMRLGRGS
jgi:hypothetical protein